MLRLQWCSIDYTSNLQKKDPSWVDSWLSIVTFLIKLIVKTFNTLGLLLRTDITKTSFEIKAWISNYIHIMDGMQLFIYTLTSVLKLMHGWVITYSFPQKAIVSLSHALPLEETISVDIPDSKGHWANMGPTYVCHINLAIRDAAYMVLPRVYHWLHIIQCGAVIVITRQFSHKYSQKTPHSSPVSTRYGVFFVDPASD